MNIYNKQKTEISQRVSVLKCDTKEKTQFILNKHRSSNKYDYNSDPWLVNLTKIEIPKNVHDLLRLVINFQIHFLQIRRLKL